MATHVFRTAASNVHPAMGVKLGPVIWFVRDVKDSGGRRVFSLENGQGSNEVGIYPPARRQLTASPRAELTVTTW